MPSHYPCPRPEALEEMLSAMIGTRVQATIAGGEGIDSDAPSLLAEFAGDGDEAGALCHVDHSVAISLGGALVGVATDAALAAIEAYKLDETAFENLREVVNVMAQLFNSDYTPHLRFRELHRQPGKLPDRVQMLRRSPMAVRQYKVKVENYATGYLSLLLG